MSAAVAIALLVLGGEPKKECHRGGCNQEICSEKDGMMSTCEARPEYDCYKKARCERQPNGKCDFTPTEELKSCLAKARKQG